MSEVGERGERWKERYDEEANKKQMELAWKKEGRRKMRSWNLGQAQRYLDREVTYSTKRLVQMQKYVLRKFFKKNIQEKN